MAQSLNLFVNVQSLSGIAGSDLNADELDSSISQNPGRIAFISDAFGFRVFRFTRTQQSGGMSKGELAKRVTDVTGTVTNVAGELNDTTHLADTTNFTADNEVGKLCVITDDNGGAGAAPEGEVAIVTANTTTQLILDNQYPFSAAVAVSDTYTNLAVNLHDDSTDGDLAIDVQGLVMADRSADRWGWNQIYGFNPGALYTTAAVTGRDPVVADAASLLDFGSDAESLWVGYCPVAVGADLVTPFRSLAFIDVWHQSQPVA